MHCLEQHAEWDSQTGEDCVPERLRVGVRGQGMNEWVKERKKVEISKENYISSLPDRQV